MSGKELARMIKLINAAAWLLLLWVWVYPRPYWLVVLLAILAPPFVLLWMKRSGGILKLGQRFKASMIDYSAPFALPIIGLSMRAAVDSTVTCLDNVWLPALVLSTMFGALTYWAIPLEKQDSTTKIMLAVLSVVYGFSTSFAANIAFDHSEPQEYRAVVTAKYMSSGRNATYRLLLSTSAPQCPASVRVPRKKYEAVTAGETVTVEIHPGLLEIPYYRLRLTSQSM